MPGANPLVGLLASGFLAVGWGRLTLGLTALHGPSTVGNSAGMDCHVDPSELPAGIWELLDEDSERLLVLFRFTKRRGGAAT
jgi:hypothetical protein